ncbi:MAG: Na+/H+ antiporter NhaC family protein [Pasteurella sp.]|nr:Na+/H+ antiporter NhaC family protein [Pasteurella sp.]
MSLIDFSGSYWSLVPPLLALALAIVTRRVILSLSIGIIVGAFMLNDTNILNSLTYIKDSVISLVYSSDDGFSTNNINIVLFLVLLGVLTELLRISGSNQAFANWAKTRIKGRRGAKLMAASLVFFTFIDDYFHSLAVGAIARPVTDKFQVSRAKLAYILDSTAAPMCVLMPVSSWGAYIITLVAGLLATHSITQYSPFEAFMTMSAMNFYAIFSIIMVFVVSYFSFDIGSMVRFEREAMSKEAVEEEAVDGGKVRTLLLPVATLILGTIAMMLYTGYEALAADGKAFSVLGAFENTTVGISLVVGGVLSLLVATACIIIDQKFNTNNYMKAWVIGAQSMSGAILILCFAWTINGVVGDMQTGKYLSTFVANGDINAAFLPAILFVLAVFMAFSTGTSWGTFGIMLPIAASMAANSDPTLVLPCLSAVMAGAVCGDHCSPISDTTILSSTGARCNHIDHVTSQLPYAMLVAVATILGYLTLGFTNSMLAGFAVTTVAFVGLLFVFKKKD